MDKSARLRFLFAKYLQRQCTPGELKELIALLQKNDAEEALSEEMELLWEEIKKDKIQYDVDWDKMYSTVISNEKEADVLINRATSKFRWPYYGIAAIFIFLVALPVYWFAVHSGTGKKGATEIPVTAINKSVNDRQTIHLPDGSTVVLNTGSKLNYPSAFSTKQRDVYLSGEGFFDIRHNPAQPFYVHIGKVSIKVLGTAFNIKSSGESGQIEVTVTRGKVQVLKEEKVLGTLTASQQLSLNTLAENVAIITKTVDTLPVIAWKPAEIYLNDISMQDAVLQMEQRFNIKIDFANPAIKNCHVTATFSEDDLPDEILAVICAVTKSAYRMENDQYIIDGKGCNKN